MYIYIKDTIIRHRAEYKKNGSNRQLVRQYTLHVSSLPYSGLCKLRGRKELGGDKLALCKGLQQTPEHQGNMGFLSGKHEVLCSFRGRTKFSRVIRNGTFCCPE